MVTELLDLGHIFQLQSVLKQVYPDLERHCHLANLAPAFCRLDFPHFLCSTEIKVQLESQENGDCREDRWTVLKHGSVYDYRFAKVVSDSLNIHQEV